MVNSRNKGANGEREAAKWLAKQFNLGLVPERNLEQVRHGGHDLLGFPPFCFEIKRQERVSLNTWWKQAIAAVTPEYSIPVVMFRRNRERWNFLVSAQFIGLPDGYIQLSEPVFIRWAEKIMRSRLPGPAPI